MAPAELVESVLKARDSDVGNTFDNGVNWAIDETIKLNTK